MQDPSPLLAVILPAYNAEAYLAAAVESILAQSYPRFSLLIVDDGSRDGTLRIAQAFAGKDTRVRVLSLPNGGPARARNAALDLVQAEGKADYVVFCDADDAYLPDAFSSFLAAAASGAELVLGGFTIVNPDGTRNDYREPSRSLTSAELGSTLADLYKANLLNQVWGKLFRAELIFSNGIRFPDYRWGEDRLFIFRCLSCCASLEVISECNYLYYMHTATSLITGFYEKKAEICLEVDEAARGLCAQFSVSDDGWFRTMFLKSIFSCISTLYSPSCPLSYREKRAYVRTILCKDAVTERLKHVSGGFFARALSLVLRTRSVSLALLAARLAAFLSTASPKLFQRIKHKK